MNTCADESCGDVFVDASRNRSRRYCSDTCANRLNVAAHRRRRREAEQTPTPVA
jgi:predicted RNA-binding Zn ribbon-like protein